MLKNLMAEINLQNSEHGCSGNTFDLLVVGSRRRNIATSFWATAVVLCSCLKTYAYRTVA